MDEDWVFPATLFVAVQYVLALGLSAALGFPATPPIVGYLAVGSVVILAGAIVMLGRAIWSLTNAGEPHPIPALANKFRKNRRELFIAALGIQLVVLQVGSLTWLKSMMPLVVPFWADPMLADLDQALFGTDPWKLLVPLDPIAPAIDTVYAMWFPIKSYVMAALLISLPSYRKSRAILSYFYTIGLFGVLGQFALSSAGPLFYDLAGFGSRFADLEPHLAPLVKVGRAYLWASYTEGSETFGSGISAMPSIHVALAAWVGIVAQTTYRPLAFLGWTFYAFILVGSVYLGWHYAIDGIAGTIAALVAWRLSEMTLRKPGIEIDGANIPRLGQAVGRYSRAGSKQ